MSKMWEFKCQCSDGFRNAFEGETSRNILVAFNRMVVASCEMDFLHIASIDC